MAMPTNAALPPARSEPRTRCPYQKIHLNRNLKPLHELTLKWGEK
jgi:hypothetical protein